ncbi:MAG TPA: response regulator [Acidimicrobiales bacterium]|nr:response regulator [Acidimicrobiales bacterium]
MAKAGKVLVVDDEEGIRVLCRVNLELGGFTVFEAGDGVEAITVARQERPDVVFLDLMMPKMDGWDTIVALRSDAATAEIPIILLTARTSEEDQIRAWGEEIFEYLPKPFNPQVLVEWATAAMQPVDPDAAAARRNRAVDQLRMVQELRRQQ